VFAELEKSLDKEYDCRIKYSMRKKIIWNLKAGPRHVPSTQHHISKKTPTHPGELGWVKAQAEGVGTTKLVVSRGKNVVPQGGVATRVEQRLGKEQSVFKLKFMWQQHHDGQLIIGQINKPKPLLLTENGTS